jgi:hypothetical protein
MLGTKKILIPDVPPKRHAPRFSRLRNWLSKKLLPRKAPDSEIRPVPQLKPSVPQTALGREHHSAFKGNH